MSILVVGSVALDSVETHTGRVSGVLGGSALYFSVAASFYTNKVNLVGIVGGDFPEKHIDFLRALEVDLTGLQTNREDSTFRWKGNYTDKSGAAKTVFTELGALRNFDPVLPESYKKLPYIFLANIDPKLQLKVLAQVDNPKLVVCDTMNMWVEHSRSTLLEVLEQVDIAILNDGEAHQLTGENNLIASARKILTYGPDRVIVKKGEHGAISMTNENFFAVPAYPLERVVDPTGAGDSFAGGLLGQIAETQDLSENGIRMAMVNGTAIASFNVEDFSIDRHRKLTREELNFRCDELRKFMSVTDSTQENLSEHLLDATIYEK